MNGKIGEMRSSQLITTFGPGAIVDLPDLSVIISGINHWDSALCSIITEPRLMKKLGVRKILSPPASETENSQGTLPAFLFPGYLVCPKCRRLASAEQFFFRDDIAYCRCESPEPPKAFPARFIVACTKGHVDDFPWHRYVHGVKKNFSCEGADLRLNDLGVTGSISDIQVQCKTCDEKRSLDDAFSQSSGGSSPLGKCGGRRPWLGRRDREDCQERLRAMLRGASNIYFPVVSSALMIPPYNNPLHTAIGNVSDRLQKVDSVGKLKNAVEMGFFPEFDGYAPEEVWQAIQDLDKLEEGPDQDLLYPEWDALRRGTGPGGEYDFETESAAIPVSYSGKLSGLTMVRRLAEVRVLHGFTRINPPPDVTTLMSEDEETSDTTDKAPLSNRTLGWFPGIMTRGEGIFIALNEKEVSDWETRKEVSEAESAMRKAYVKFCEDRKLPVDPDSGFPEARYILLHTLAHALMRQLCLNSGYSSTALRERIYSGTAEGRKMAGLLIYTATPDSEGSLGGLVELGQTEKFGGILWQALEESRFCSGDPLCAEHTPEFLGDINGASCHACLLAPETACERSNRFLDRSFLVPTVSAGNLSFFS